MRLIICSVVLLTLLAMAPSLALRCFVAEFEPQHSDAEHTNYSYYIDTLADTPVELTFEGLEFGPVIADRCTWSGKVDALELRVNGALASYWPLHCSDSHTLQFSVGTLGSDWWGRSPRSPTDGSRTYAMQYGHVDVLTATWSPVQAASRFREVVLRLYSGSQRQFMPSMPVPVLPVRVCLLDAQVPNDIVGTPYNEIEHEPHSVWPLSSCVYEHTGRCGAQIGYVAGDSESATAALPVIIKRHASHNYITPSYVENGWRLPESFAGLQAPDTADPRMHVGWICEEESVRWYLNGSMLHLNQQTRRCPASPFRTGDPAADAARFGVNPDAPFAIEKPLQREPVRAFTAEEAQSAWAKAGVEVPVLAERIEAQQQQQQQQ